MSFYQKYDLTRLIGDGDAKTFRAVENATGRAVFVHLFNPAGQGLLGRLRSRFEVGGKAVAPVIEIGEFAGSAYAVTEVIEPFTSLRDWVDSWTTPVSVAECGVGAPARPAGSPARPVVQEADAGEFTRQFQVKSPARLPEARATRRR